MRADAQQRGLERRQSDGRAKLHSVALFRRRARRLELRAVEAFTPLPLRRLREPFDDPACVYEIKYDGFRSLLFLEPRGAALVSRYGNRFGRFAPLADALRRSLRVRSAVIDGEVVCLDADGRPQFDDLLFGRGVPSFVAFDLVAVDGRDLRALPLVERKRRLRRLVPRRSPSLLYASHVVATGRALFAAACARDLEGVVAKPARSPYALIAGRSPWVKIKFREYSQARDRHELFARQRRCG